MKSYTVTIQMKATEQFFPVVLFIMLYKMVLNFEFVNEILQCNHSNVNCKCAMKGILTSYSLMRSLSKVLIR